MCGKTLLKTKCPKCANWSFPVPPKRPLHGFWYFPKTITRRITSTLLKLNYNIWVWFILRGVYERFVPSLTPFPHVKRDRLTALCQFRVRILMWGGKCTEGKRKVYSEFHYPRWWVKRRGGSMLDKLSVPLTKCFLFLWGVNIRILNCLIKLS